MAKIYDVYDDFKEEIKNISHFFNLSYNDKKISNEEFIFNFLEQQLTEKKIADCVNILKEQNKVVNQKIPSQEKEEDLKKRKKQVKTNVDNKLSKVDVAPKDEKGVEEKVITENTTTGEKTKVESLPKDPLKKVIKEVSNKVPEGVKNIEDKVCQVIDTIKDNFDKTAKKLKIKKEHVEHKEQILTFVKNDHESNFERKYCQNGKYVIDGVDVGTSVFGKCSNVNVVEKHCEKKDKGVGDEKCVEKTEVKNKKFKINCNIDQNLLNGCYWPTQLS